MQIEDRKYKTFDEVRFARKTNRLQHKFTKEAGRKIAIKAHSYVTSTNK